MILVVGASGRLGGTIARHLLCQGERVRALTRTLARLENLKVLGAEVVGGDMRDPASLKSACQGIEQVITTAHAGEGKGTNVPRIVDEAGNRHLIDGAKAAGVRHFVFISTHGARSEPNAARLVLILSVIVCFYSAVSVPLLTPRDWPHTLPRALAGVLILAGLLL